MGEILIAMGGILVGAAGGHLLTQQRERNAEEQRARNICRILYRDLFLVSLAIQNARFKNLGRADEDPWPPNEVKPAIQIKLSNWERLGPDFTMVCRDEELWEAVCIAFEEAEALATNRSINDTRLGKAEARIFDALERTADVNRSWSKKVKKRWKFRRPTDEPNPPDGAWFAPRE